MVNELAKVSSPVTGWHTTVLSLTGYLRSREPNGLSAYVRRLEAEGVDQDGVMELKVYCGDR